jgi:glycosyltransferase involved in cell wall biosynthesis
MKESHTNHLKISILTSSSAWGGMEVHTAELARALEAKGHEISIIEVGSNVYEQGKFDHGKKISVIRLDDSRPLGTPGLMKSFRILRKPKGNVCIFPKGEIYSGSWQLDLAARLLFSRFITIEHKASLPLPPKSSKRHMGGLLPGIGLWWYRTKLNNFLRSLWPHRVVCVSDNVGKRLIDDYRFPPRKVATVHNGIDPDTFQPRLDCRAAVRTTWGIPRDALVFGAIGRFHPWKGFVLALELFRKMVSGASRDVRFVLVGDGPEYGALKRLAEEPDVREKVRLVGFTDRPWEIYPAFDVFLMPSHKEGLPLSLLEAMACECCPIAMGVGGIPEVINDPGLGWLVQPDDQRGFFEAMKEAAGIGPGRLREMGRKARERVVMNFDARRQFSALADLIEKECGDDRIQEMTVSIR